MATVRRGSSFGASFEAHMEPKGETDDPESPLVLLENPCGFKGGRGIARSSGITRPIIHLSKIAYPDGETEVSEAAAPVLAQDPPPPPIIDPSRDSPPPSVSGPPVFGDRCGRYDFYPFGRSMVSKWQKLARGWEDALIVGIATAGLFSRASAAIPDLLVLSPYITFSPLLAALSLASPNRLAISIGLVTPAWFPWRVRGL